MHNALQGGGIDLSSKKEIFEQVIYENRCAIFSIATSSLHDPQPLPSTDLSFHQ